MASRSDISERARTLISQHITSIEQLEILLLLRSEPARSWKPEEVDDRIRSSLSSVSARLADLADRGFLRRDGDGYRYDPGPERAAAVDELSHAYAQRRYSVIDLILSSPSDKLKVFARAFRIRRDDDG
jgi:hypothetical protein